MEFYEIFCKGSGTSFVLITFFWIVVFSIIFGIDALGDGAIAMLLCFFIIGTTFLVGVFGWQFLVIPSIAIIAGAGFFVWKFMSRF